MINGFLQVELEKTYINKGELYRENLRKYGIDGAVTDSSFETETEKLIYKDGRIVGKTGYRSKEYHYSDSPDFASIYEGFDVGPIQDIGDIKIVGVYLTDQPGEEYLEVYFKTDMPTIDTIAEYYKQPLPYVIPLKFNDYYAYSVTFSKLGTPLSLKMYTDREVLDWSPVASMETDNVGEITIYIDSRGTIAYYNDNHVITDYAKGVVMVDGKDKIAFET